MPVLCQVQPVNDAAPAVVELGLFPTDVAMRVLDGFATATGLPYWMSIVAVTMALRTFMVPFSLIASRNAARMSLMKPEMDRLKEGMEV